MAHLIKGAAGEEGREIFFHWAARWDGDVNPEEDARVWDTLGQPRLGWDSLCPKAARFGFHAAPEVPAGRPGGDSELATIRLSDVAMEPVEWLWEGYIPYKKLTILDGDPGVGKSTLMLDVAARLSVGGQMPYGSSNCDAGPVLLLTAEDGLGDTVRPRLEAAGADLSKIEAINAETLPSFPESIDAVRATITRTGAKLVIIDPLSDFFSRNLNPYVDQHCRAALTPLARVAEETRAATVIVRHVRKGGDGPAIHRGGGSIGMIAVARVGLVVVQDPDDEERRVLAVAKCNLGQRATSLVFHLQSVTDHTARIEWEGPSPHSADALVAASRRSQQSGDDVERVAMLREFLSDGPKWWDDIRSLYPDAGYAVADRTIRRDGKKLHVIVERIGFQGQVMWSLPRDAALIQTEPNLGGGRASSWFE